MDENKASTPSSSPISSSPNSGSFHQSVGSFGPRRLKQPRLGGSVDVAGVVSDLEVASRTHDRVRLYARLSDVEDSFATPDRTSPAWLDCKDCLLQSCLRDCVDDRDHNAAGQRLRDYAFNWLAILFVRCDNWSKAQVSRIELVLFRFLGLAEGLVSEIQQGNGWAVLHARFVKGSTNNNLHLFRGDQSGEDLVIASRAVQRAFRMGLSKVLLNQSLYAAVPSVLLWIAERHPRLMFHGNETFVPPLINFSGLRHSSEAAELALEFEIGLWEATEAALSKMVLEAPSSDPAWSEVGSFLDTLTRRTLELNIVALASIDLKDSIAEIGTIMAVVLSTFLPTPAARIDSSSKEDSAVKIAPLLGFIAIPCVRLALLVLEAAATTAALSDDASFVRAPGNLQPSSTSSMTLSDVHFADALIHTPQATGAWAALVDFVISGSDSGAFIENLVHFSLFGVASQDECRPPQCSLVMLRRGLVPILAGALFDTIPAARAASATAIDIWRVARTHLSISSSLLLDLIGSHRNGTKKEKKKKSKSSSGDPSPGNDMTMHASSDHGTSSSAQHFSSESTSDLGKITAGALLVLGCFVPVGSGQDHENRSIEDSVGYLDPIVVVKGSAFSKAACSLDKRGNLFSLRALLERATLHCRTKKKRRQSSLVPETSSPSKKLRSPNPDVSPDEGNALDSTEAKRAASVQPKGAVPNECLMATKNTRDSCLEPETGASVPISDIRRCLAENTATIDRALKAIEHQKQVTEQFVQDSRQKMDALLTTVESARGEMRRLEDLLRVHLPGNNA